MSSTVAASADVPVRVYGPEESPDLVYFSSASGNTHRFVLKLERPAARIPMRPRKDGALRMSRPYVLLVPSYGGGDPRKAVPPQVRRFLNDRINRSWLRGVITSGNTNFGEDYGIAGRVIARKTGVPLLYRFELLGTGLDVARVREGLDEFWRTIDDPDHLPPRHLKGRPTT